MQYTGASQATRAPLLGHAKALFVALLLALAASLVSAPLGLSEQAVAGYSKQSAKKYGKSYRKKRYAKRRHRKYRKSARRSYKRSHGKKKYSRYKSRKKRYAYRSAKRKHYSKKRRHYGAAKRYRYKKRKTKVAALGSYYAPKRKSLTGGGVRWAASSGCLNGTLKSVVYQVAANYGSVTVNSTCRSKRRNRAVGGAKRSWHLSGNAVDFRVHGNYRGVYAYLRSNSSLGGVKHYGGGLFHIDTGPRRSW